MSVRGGLAEARLAALGTLREGGGGEQAVIQGKVLVWSRPLYN